MKLSEVSGQEPKRLKLSDVQAEAEKPSALEKAGAAAYGLGTSLVGGLGDIESMVTAPAVDPKFRGKETVFPTTENVRTGLEKLGLPQPRKEVSGYQTAGELAPLAVMGARGLYGMGKYGATALSDLLAGKGTAAKEAAERLKTAIPRTAEEAEKGVAQKAATETQAEYEKRARRQASFGQAQEKATTAAQAERESAALKYSDLGKPADPAKLGDEMQRRLSGTEARRASARARQAENDANAYFADARTKGNFVASDQGKSFLNSLRNRIFSQTNTPAERKIAEEMYRDLSEAKDIEAVEKTFRKFQERASGLPKEGYDAVTQQFAGKISKDLSESLNVFSPKRKEFRDTYRDLSSPLDAYATRFGKKPLATEKAVEGQLQMMPTDYPNYYFKNRDTINVLRQQLAGDEAAVRKFANQHAVNELKGKTADQAAKWLETNNGWLNTVEGLNTRVNRYVTELKRAETAAATKEAQATKLGAKAKEVGKAGEARQAEIAKTAGEQAEKIRNFKEQISLYPEKATAIADNMVKYLTVNKMLPPEKISALKSELDAVSQTADAAKKASEVRNLFVKYGILSAGAGYGTYEIGKRIF